MAQILATQIADGIVEHIRTGRLPVGTHLATPFYAEMFKVSRVPVIAALKKLEEDGVVVSERNRGFFLSRGAEELKETEPAPKPTAEDAMYYQLAEDWLSGKLVERVSENELMRFYGIARGRLVKVLHRAAEDLWVERLPGNGWRFQAVLVSGQAYEEGYRFRAVIEPAALLEPGFRIDPLAAQELRRQQESMIAGGIETCSRSELFEMGSRFHETLTGFSQNPFFIDAVRKVNRLRRLLDYRSMLSRARLPQQCHEHLHMLDLVEEGRNMEAADFLRRHLLGALAGKRSLITNLPNR